LIENQEYRLDPPLGCPDSIYQLMRSCWSLEPNNRPTFANLHKAFSENPEHRDISSHRDLYQNPGDLWPMEIESAFATQWEINATSWSSSHFDHFVYSTVLLCVIMLCTFMWLCSSYYCHFLSVIMLLTVCTLVYICRLLLLVQYTVIICRVRNLCHGYIQ